MTHLIPANLALFYRCLSLPADWRERKGVLTVQQPQRSLIERQRKPVNATEFDPWEKRDEFFTLKQNDTPALVTFLGTVGFFERPAFPIKNHSALVGHAAGRIPDADFPYEVYYTSRMLTNYVWGLRTLLMDCLTQNERMEGQAEFEVRIERLDGSPRVVFTTLTFIDAMLLTLTVDQAKRAKVRKCARPDCGIPFTQTTGYEKKFHCWDCGHIESVRRQRRRARANRKKGGNKSEHLQTR